MGDIVKALPPTRTERHMAATQLFSLFFDAISRAFRRVLLRAQIDHNHRTRYSLSKQVDHDLNLMRELDVDLLNKNAALRDLS
jgi:hypothetical protein